MRGNLQEKRMIPISIVSQGEYGIEHQARFLSYPHLDVMLWESRWKSARLLRMTLKPLQYLLIFSECSEVCPGAKLGYQLYHPVSTLIVTIMLSITTCHPRAVNSS